MRAISLAVAIVVSCITLSQMSALAQPNYDHLWKEVQQKESSGLPRQALEMTEKIHTMAVNEGNGPQRLKAVIHRMRFLAAYSEEHYQESIEFLHKEIESTQMPLKQIFQSVMAEVYWRYFRDDMHRIMERSSLDMPGSDPRFWDARTFTHTIQSIYLQSLEPATALFAIPVRNFAEILDTAEGSAMIRPALFDLLLHRAMDFLTSGDASLGQPVFPPYPMNPMLFSHGQVFQNLELSLPQRPETLILSLYQRAYKLHENDQEPDGWIALEFERLSYVKSLSASTQGEDLYRDALHDLLEKFRQHPVSTGIAWRLAEDYNRSAQSYDPWLNTESKWDRQKAYTLCETALKAFPASFYAPHCRRIMMEMEKPGIWLSLHEAIPQGTESLALLKYQNVKRVELRLIRVDPEEDRSMRQFEGLKEMLKSYQAIPPVARWDVDLLDDGDYHIHGVEIPVTSLDKGYYVLMAMAGDTSEDNMPETAAAGGFWVTDIAFTSRQMENGDLEILVMDRNSGKPLESAIISVFYRQYDYRSRKMNIIPGPVYSSDKDGFAILKHQQEGRQHHAATLSIKYKGDLLATDDRFYIHSVGVQDPRARNQCYLFTDRAVYRPGQLIYYKGVLFASDGIKHQLMNGKTLNIKLMDGNGRIIAEQPQTTGDYGSFHGSFNAPTGVLLGECLLVCEYGQVGIRVEEYKRPRFEIGFDPMHGEFRLGDTVTVTGKAMGYAGDPLGGAKVRYRVERSSWFPYPWYGRFGIRPRGNSQRLVSGETITNLDGSFSVPFQALGSQGTDMSFKPVFRFIVHVDVMDLSGETQHNQTSLDIGQQSLMIFSEIPMRIDRHRGHSYKIEVRNSQGKPVAVDLDLQISRLQEPFRLLRKRLWDPPDRHLLDREDFANRFPLDPWAHEGNPIHWKQIEPIRSHTYYTGTDTIMNLNTLTALPEGVYLLEFRCIDKFGDTIKRQDIIELFSQTHTKSLFNNHLWSHLSQDKANPGDHVSLILSSAHPDARVWIEMVNSRGLKERKWYFIGKGTRAINIPVTWEDKGDLLIDLFGVMDSRSFTARHTLTVEDRDLFLDVTFQRFRDKIKPGETEEWELRFRTDKGEPALPEVLLSMYDASLDVISPHAWYFFLHGRPTWRVPWNVDQSMRIRNALSLEPFLPFSEPLRYQEYDKLNWFGMNFWFGGGYGRGIKTGLRMDDSMLRHSLSSFSTESNDVSAKGEPDEQEKTENGNLENAEEKPFSGIEMRRSLGETAFFFPMLYADSNGDLVLRFKAPEAVTRWNILGFAHTQGLRHAHFRKQLITAKDLMLIPNLPRMLYEGDKIWLKAKVVNSGVDTLTGIGSLEIEDVLTGKNLAEMLEVKDVKISFHVPPGSSDTLIWGVEVPNGSPSLLRIRMKASTPGMVDGEEHMIPVLSPRMLVTETFPLFMKGKGEKTWHFEALSRSLSKPGISGHQMTLEYTLQPAWNVVKAIPSLLEKGGHSSQQIFTRVFAHSLGLHLIASHPAMAEVIHTWAQLQPDGLLSELDKNEDLKSIVLEETPWVRDAASETASRRRLAMFLNENTLRNAIEKDIAALCALQLPSGAWPWFPGMPASRHMTQQILIGIGKLQALGALEDQTNSVGQASQQAIRWVISQLVTDLEALKRHQSKTWEEHKPTPDQVQALYALSFFMDESRLKGKDAEAWRFYFDRASKTWVDFSLQLQALYGSAALRGGRTEDARMVLASLNDRALRDVDGGMYWKSSPGGYQWHEAPVETQAMLIAFFAEVKESTEKMDAMKMRLLRHKQLNRWETNTATAEACYALVHQGTDWLGKRSGLTIHMGEKKIEPDKTPSLQLEAGSGYFRKDFPAVEINKESSNIRIHSSNTGPSWGAIYWQYFQEMSEIEAHSGGLTLRKTLALVEESNKGQTLIPYSPEHALHIGDRVRVRLEIEIDREMEYIHLQDHKPASMESVNQQSGYRYQGGLGWYESIRDAGTDIFFEFLPRGSHVIEYDFFVTQEGDFSSGPAKMQSLYAPSFSAHTGGQRVVIKP